MSQKNITQVMLPNLLTSEQITKVKNFKHWMASKRYSNNTINTYTEALKLFLKFYSHKPITDITNDDVIAFNNDYIIAKHLSTSFQNQTVNAIKLFFVTVENKQIKLELIHRPKREKTLPSVLSKEEVKQLLNAHSNIKHKTMLSLIYACGLRCGELLKLKPEHVDSKRHVLIIKNGKGKKDRITPLGEAAIEMLRKYFKI